MLLLLLWLLLRCCSSCFCCVSCACSCCLCSCSCYCSYFRSCFWFALADAPAFAPAYALALTPALAFAPALALTVLYGYLEPRTIPQTQSRINFREDSPQGVVVTGGVFGSDDSGHYGFGSAPIPSYFKVTINVLCYARCRFEQPSTSV